MADHIEDLLATKVKHRAVMLRGRRECKTRDGKRQWSAWIKRDDEEIEALRNAQKSIAGLRAVKIAARS
jgi:DNA mismatch repair ATPase MutS